VDGMTKFVPLKSSYIGETPKRNFRTIPRKDLLLARIRRDYTLEVERKFN